MPSEIRSTGNTLRVAMVTDENTSFDRGFKASTRTGKLAHWNIQSDLVNPDVDSTPIKTMLK